ncbi:MAG: glycosyltransferase family 4 protein [Planctomycetes bacterium]|nr:glycosyltransferase family 4 protein [Planctomycetota bacterium]
MRIGIDALLLGKFDSGVELYIRCLIRALSRADSENEYTIYLTRDADPPDIAGSPRFALRRLPFRSGKRAVRVLWEQVCLPKIIRKGGIDVFHAPGYVMPIRCAVPTVVTVHDVIALTHPELCKRSNAAHYRLLMPPTIRRASRIVASSEATKAGICSVVGVAPEKIEVIHPGVDAGVFRGRSPAEAVRRKYNLPDRYLLFVGNIEPKKNLPVLFEAYRFLRRERKVQIPLVVIGKRGWKCGPAFEAVRRLRLDRHVLFRGYAAREDLPGIYRGADVFTFPSIVEGFGLPLLEAMAAGVPVVTSTAPAVREAIGDAGLTVPSDAPRLLAIAIHKVLTNTFLRTSLIERGQERVKLFSWQGVAERMIEIYREAVQTEKA